MAKRLRIRGGTEAQNDAFTGASRELTVDTTNWVLRLHDGTTEGGIKIATQSYVDAAALGLVDGASGAGDTLSELDSRITALEGATSFSGSWNDLTDTPALFSGDYNDLANLPSIPTDISDLTDSSGLLGGGGGGGGNPFDQDLNTTDNVTFNSASIGSISDTSTITSNGIEIYTNPGSGGSIDLYTDWSGSGTTGGLDLWLVHGDGIYLKTDDGNYVWKFNNAGKLELPSGGDIVDSSGNSVLGGGTPGLYSQVEPPVTAIGQPGDTADMIAFDSSYSYYCTAAYDGVTNIWKRRPWSADIW